LPNRLPSTSITVSHASNARGMKTRIVLRVSSPETSKSTSSSLPDRWLVQKTR